MARRIEQLKPADVRRLIEAREPGAYADGAGLYLRITATGAASWSLRYRGRELGLGSTVAVTLAEARRKAKQARDEIDAATAAGVDPVQQRKAARAPAAPAEPAVTFQQAAEQCIGNRAGKWRNPITPKQWLASLARYAFPVIGGKAVASITKADVDAVLRPIWATKMETASRVKMRLGVVLDYAAEMDWRGAGDNPAKYTPAAVEHRLGGRIKRVKNLASLPAEAIPGFVARLRQRGGMAARSVEFIVLTAARSMEARGATWAEIDLTAKLWRIPAARMKTHEEHLIPLSDASVALLETVRGNLGKPAPSALIFPGPTGRPLSDVAISKIAKLCAPVPVTVHGFRASFRGWAEDKASWAACEHCLAHKVKGVAGAYVRPEATLAARRVLLDAWADYCDGAPVPLPAAAFADAAQQA
jgi:integrase